MSGNRSHSGGSRAAASAIGRCGAELESALIRVRVRALRGLGGPYSVQYRAIAKEATDRSRVWFRTGLDRTDLDRPGQDRTGP